MFRHVFKKNVITKCHQSLEKATAICNKGSTAVIGKAESIRRLNNDKISL